jgi:soluble lytic murein transglycosylase-like protein
MSNRLNHARQPTESDYSYATADAIKLPDSVSVVPASFNGRSPSDGSYQVASLPPYPIVEQESQIVYALPDSPRGEVDRLIGKYAAEYEVPETLVRRVVKRESNFNPRARNRVYWGLMQIRHDTARGMGYEGDASGLLDAETNLKYAVKYLRGAWIVGGYNQDAAVRHYQRGYYYDAKRKGLLKEAGLR